MEANEIIVRPLLTEKSYSGTQNKTYTFVVKTSDYKKAIVTLTEKSKPIAFFESLS